MSNPLTTDANGIEQLLKKRDVAAALDISIRTLERMVEDGELMLVHPGEKSARITRSSYDAMIARLVQQAMKKRAV